MELCDQRSDKQTFTQALYKAVFSISLRTILFFDSWLFQKHFIMNKEVVQAHFFRSWGVTTTEFSLLWEAWKQAKGSGLASAIKCLELFRASQPLSKGTPSQKGWSAGSVPHCTDLPIPTSQGWGVSWRRICIVHKIQPFHLVLPLKCNTSRASFFRIHLFQQGKFILLLTHFSPRCLILVMYLSGLAALITVV